MSLGLAAASAFLPRAEVPELGLQLRFRMCAWDCIRCECASCRIELLLVPTCEVKDAFRPAGAWLFRAFFAWQKCDVLLEYSELRCA